MKRSKALKTAIVSLWSADQSERLEALETLNEMAVDMVDIRTAQPALTMLLSDESTPVRRAALSVIEYRADMGADVGMAVPELLTLQDDSDEEIRRLARRALRFANDRLHGLLTDRLTG